MLVEPARDIPNPDSACQAGSDGTNHHAEDSGDDQELDEGKGVLPTVGS
ncbi:MAG: hypothetical protein QGH42_02795 [Kiritimatiellia bacterium]|nr:hypothetical protein [Kiritimatiellia bacterium]MDP7023165.1 hypothetical protein [Kiritimatiellia bacterium]